MQKKIYDYALTKGTSLVGFTGAHAMAGAPEGFRPTDIMPAARGIIVLAKVLPKGIITSDNAAVYTLHHTNLMEQLDTLAYDVALFIEQHGGLGQYPFRRIILTFTGKTTVSTVWGCCLIATPQ